MQIALNDLKFHSRHGLYAEETTAGGEFVVNVIINFNPAHLPVLSLDDTVNYVDVYELIKKRMDVAEQILEKLAYRIANDILQLDDKINTVEIEVFKQHPPIIQFNGRVGVKIEVKREEI
jgi:dihydroneopterin aldolase